MMPFPPMRLLLNRTSFFAVKFAQILFLFAAIVASPFAKVLLTAIHLDATPFFRRDIFWFPSLITPGVAIEPLPASFPDESADPKAFRPVRPFHCRFETSNHSVSHGSEWTSERMNERSGARERSEQCKASEWVSGASGRVSGPVLNASIPWSFNSRRTNSLRISVSRVAKRPPFWAQDALADHQLFSSSSANLSWSFGNTL